MKDFIDVASRFAADAQIMSGVRSAETVAAAGSLADENRIRSSKRFPCGSAVSVRATACVSPSRRSLGSVLVWRSQPQGDIIIDL